MRISNPTGTTQPGITRRGSFYGPRLSTRSIPRPPQSVWLAGSQARFTTASKSWAANAPAAFCPGGIAGPHVQASWDHFAATFPALATPDQKTAIRGLQAAAGTYCVTAYLGNTLPAFDPGNPIGLAISQPAPYLATAAGLYIPAITGDWHNAAVYTIVCAAGPFTGNRTAAVFLRHAGSTSTNPNGDTSLILPFPTPPGLTTIVSLRRWLVIDTVADPGVRRAPNYYFRSIFPVIGPP